MGMLQRTLSVSLDEFPGLEDGLQGKGKLEFRVESVKDGRAELVLTDLKLENGNMADKRMRDMMGPGNQRQEESDDEDVEDI